MTAVVFVSGPAADPRFRLGGMTLVERTLVVARRAGVRRCLIAGACPEIAADPRFPRLTPVADAADALAVLRSEGTRRALCLHAGVVTTPAALTRFLALATGPRGAAVRGVPLAVVDAEDLVALWAPFLSPEPPCDPAALGCDAVVPHGAFAFVSRAEQAAAVERDLLRALDNPRDGRVDTFFNRRVSRWLSRHLLHFSLTPNQVTLLSFLAALGAAFAFARGSYASGLAGAVLFQFAAVLDCCDGEVARVRYQESRLGDALDIGLDALGNVAVFLGIARGAWRVGELDDATAIAWTIGLGIAFTFPLVTWIERTLPEPAATPPHRLAQRLVAALTSRDFSVVVLAAALAGVLPWFLRGAALGANVFWIALAVLLWRGR